MTSANKIFAFISYFFLIPGWLFVMIFRRKHPSELFHARQSLVITMAPMLALVLWFVFTWLVLAFPIIGPLLAWFAFAIVMAGSILSVVLWIVGMVRALLDDEKPLAIVGGWAEKLPF